MPSERPHRTEGRVVVGVDPSPAGPAAVRLAAREAALRGRDLRLVYAMRWPAAPDGQPWPAAEEVLARATEVALAAAPELRVSTVVGEDTLVATLLRESHLAGLVVLDDGDLRTRIGLPLDAPAVELAARAHGTVLLARGAGRDDDGPVLVGVDRSAGGERALEVGFETAAARGAELVVVRVREDEAPDPDGVGAVQLAETVGPWQDKYPGVRTHYEVRTGEPARVLVELSRSAGMVVVGACGEHVRAPLGSVAQAVLHHADCPTMVVRGIPAAG